MWIWFLLDKYGMNMITYLCLAPPIPQILNPQRYQEPALALDHINLANIRNWTTLRAPVPWNCKMQTLSKFQYYAIIYSYVPPTTFCKSSIMHACYIKNDVNRPHMCTFAIMGLRYTSGELIFRPRIVPPMILSLFGFTMSSRAIGLPWFITLCGFDPPLLEPAVSCSTFSGTSSLHKRTINNSSCYKPQAVILTYLSRFRFILCP